MPATVRTMPSNDTRPTKRLKLSSPLAQEYLSQGEKYIAEGKAYVSEGKGQDLLIKGLKLQIKGENLRTKAMRTETAYHSKPYAAIRIQAVVRGVLSRRKIH